MPSHKKTRGKKTSTKKKGVHRGCKCGANCTCGPSCPCGKKGKK